MFIYQYRVAQTFDCNILTAKNIQQVHLEKKTRSNDELIMHV